MSVRRVVEIECDLCSELRVYEAVVEAKAAGWTRDRWIDGTICDLCPACVKEVAPAGAASLTRMRDPYEEAADATR